MEENKNNFFAEENTAAAKPIPAGQDQTDRNWLANFKLKARGLFSGLGDVRNFFKTRGFLIGAGAVLALVLLYIILTSILKPADNPGVIAPPETPDYQEIVVEGEPEILKREDNESVAVVHLRNPNKKVGLEKLSYNWTAIDAQGNALEAEGSTYILPEQNKYILIPFKQFVPVGLNFSLNSHTDQFEPPAYTDDLSLQIVNQYRKIEPDKYVVGGDVYNQSLYRVGEVDITVLYFDNLNRLVGAAATKIGPIDSGETGGFEVFWPDSLSESVVTQIRLSADRFSSLNITLP